MYKGIIFAVLIVGAIGCATLKDNFGTGAETPALKAARAECRSQAEKEAAKYQNPIKREDYNRYAFTACMEQKGYNRQGKKVN